MEIVDCPECAAPAEVESRSTLESTCGPVEHVKIRCVRKHWFLLPRGLLASPAPVDTPGIDVQHAGTP
jgi:hypothetical protein